ncbi:MAG: hypothetical protein ABW047_15515 [Nitrospiraceae bacterium]
MTSKLTWTFDKPTIPGFYWMKASGARDRIIEIGHDGRHGLYVVHLGRPLGEMPEDFAWSGPIEHPR